MILQYTRSTPFKCRCRVLAFLLLFSAQSYCNTYCAAVRYLCFPNSYTEDIRLRCGKVTAEHSVHAVLFERATASAIGPFCITKICVKIAWMPTIICCSLFFRLFLRDLFDMGCRIVSDSTQLCTLDICSLRLDSSTLFLSFLVYIVIEAVFTTSESQTWFHKLFYLLFGYAARELCTTSWKSWQSKFRAFSFTFDRSRTAVLKLCNELLCKNANNCVCWVKQIRIELPGSPGLYGWCE